jgi:hypothetical protein
MSRALVISACVVAASGLVAQEQSTDIIEAPNHERYSRSAYEAGRRDAEKDIRQNHLVVEMFGGPLPPWNDDWLKLLNDRYHIYVKEVAGDVVDYQVLGHARGYNEISKAEIQRRFGSDVVSKTLEEVRSQWKQTHPE